MTSPKIRSSTPGAINLQAGVEPSPGYRLQRLRGRGGFAEVWESTSPNGTPVALKFMATSNACTTAREVRSMQSFLTLNHPNLVLTNAVWSLPGYIVINMELAEATLLDLMLVYHNELGQHIEAPLLCLYMWQVADVLDFLNMRHHPRDGRRVGYQHGDVKPNNILLFGDKAKLTDHGLATPTYGAITPCPRQGTREYAAPEIFLGYYSDASDQFSLAVTYYVLRTGMLPFPPPPEQLSRSFSRPIADLSEVSEAERPALIRALSPVPQNRFPCCLDFMTAILRAHGIKAIREDDDESKPWKIAKDDLPEPPKSQLLKLKYARASHPGELRKPPVSVLKKP